MKKGFLISIIAALFITACGSDNGSNPIIDDPNDSTFAGLYFNIKSATVIYSNENYAEGNQNVKLVFDDYGKKIRSEVGEVINIVDEDAKKVYILYPAEKMYMEAEITMAASFRYNFIYLGDDVANAWQYYPGFNKNTKTIAGKSCSVCSWNYGVEEWEWGGYKRITFLHHEKYDGVSQKLEAISYNESADANAFTVPSDYTKF